MNSTTTSAPRPDDNAIGTGSLFELTVQDIALGGDGIGPAPDGRIVFVPFAAVGDRLQVRVVAAQPRLLRAEIAAILEPGPGRIPPPCPWYGHCGGCRYQHLDYALQPKLKERQAESTLKRLGGLASLPPPEPVVAAPAPYHYRNKLKLQAFREGDQVLYGFCALDNVTRIGIDSCPLAAPELNAFIPQIAKLPGSEINARSREPQDLTLRRLADGTVRSFFGPPPRGAAWVQEQLLGRPVNVPPGSFWQVNPPVAEVLVQTVAGWFQGKPTELFVDAYAGVGPFSLAVGTAARQHLLIESDPSAISAAKANAAAWGLKGAKCLSGKTEKMLPAWLAQVGKLANGATVLLDPPRTGCEAEMLDTLRQSAVRRLVYVSCHPATLARDLKRLCGDGPRPFAIRKWRVFDMFPQTPHLETAVLMER